MKVFVAGFAALAIVVGGGVPAWAAGTLGGATSHGSVTVTVSDITFDGPDCVDVPIQMTYSKSPSDPENIRLSASVEMFQQGSNSPSTGSLFSGGYEPATGVVLGDVFVCPSTFKPEAGPVTARGVLESKYYVNDSVQTAQLAPTVEVNINRNPTTMSVPRLSKGYSYQPKSRTIKGKATAATTKGAIGAGGQIVIAVKTPGSRKWVGGVDTYLDEFGNWETTLPSAPKGSLVRVSLVNCGWCSDAQRIVKVTR